MPHKTCIVIGCLYIIVYIHTYEPLLWYVTDYSLLLYSYTNKQSIANYLPCDYDIPATFIALKYLEKFRIKSAMCIIISSVNFEIFFIIIYAFKDNVQ